MAIISVMRPRAVNPSIQKAVEFLAKAPKDLAAIQLLLILFMIPFLSI